MRGLPLLISHYGWILQAAVVACCILFIPHYETTESFKSTNFTTEYVAYPYFVFHAANPKVNAEDSDSMDRWTNARGFMESMSSHPAVITGDLTENGIDGGPDSYAEVMRKTRVSPYNSFIAPGMGDIAGLMNYTSKKNYLGRLMGTDYRGFQLFHDYDYDSDDNKVHFITITPFMFPNIKTPIESIPSLTSDFLNRLDLLVSSIPSSERIIYASALPFEAYPDNTKSDYSKTFKEIIKNRDGYFLSGKKGLKSHVVRHHGKVIEFIGPDLSRSDKVGILVLKGYQATYHTIPFSTSKQCLVINPLPVDQLSPKTSFYDLHPYMTLLCLSSVYNVDIQGDIYGSMDCYRGGPTICTYPLTVTQGQYSVAFTGDYFGTYEFSVASVSPDYKEKKMYLSVTDIRVCGIFLAIVGLFILIPIPIPRCIRTGTKWTQGEVSDQHWFSVCVLSVVYMNHLIRSSPLVLRIFLMITVLAPLVGMMVFVNVEGTVGVVWLFGTVLDNKVAENVTGPVMYILYFVFYYLPNILLLASFITNSRCKRSMVLEWILFVLFKVGETVLIYFNWSFLKMSYNIPIFEVVTFAWIVIWGRKRKVDSIPLLGEDELATYVPEAD